MILGTEEHKKSQEFFTCSCHAEGVLVTDWEFKGGIDDLDISLAMFTHGTIFPKRKLLSRVKYAWKHLMTGELWEDEVILTYTSAERMGKYLIERARIKKEEHIKQIEKNQKDESRK